MTEHLLTCDDLAELLSAAIDGETDVRERELIDTHLGECPTCRAHLDADRVLRRRTLLAPVRSVSDIVERASTIPLPDRSLRRRTVVGIAAAAAVFLIAAGALFVAGPRSDHRRVASGASPTSGSVHTVRISGERFGTSHVVIESGTRVRWANADSVTHDLVVRTPGAVVDSELHPRNTESVTFDKPGTFEFACRIHAGMAGSVTVVAR